MQNARYRFLLDTANGILSYIKIVRWTLPKRLACSLAFRLTRSSLFRLRAAPRKPSCVCHRECAGSTNSYLWVFVLGEIGRACVGKVWIQRDSRMWGAFKHAFTGVRVSTLTAAAVVVFVL